MTENYSNIDDIIISFLQDKLSVKEKEMLEDWLASTPANKTYFKEIYKIWNTVELLNRDDKEANEVFQKVKFQVQNALTETREKVIDTRMRRFSFVKWAAVVLISLCSGAFVYSYFVGKTSLNTSKNAYNEVAVPFGSKSKIRLPDGTKVTLNAGSKLTYRMDYGEKLREVALSGEGYFEVASQKEKPFIVHTIRANVRALGTEFNVKAYPEEDMVETILVKGSVVVNKVSDSNKTDDLKKNQGVVLKPGQKIQVFKRSRHEYQNIINHPETKNRNSGKDSITKIADFQVFVSDTKVETSWKEKRWIIQGIDMENLAVLLSRKFDVTIRILDSRLKNNKFSGIIANETIEEVFSIIKFTIPISYTIDKGDVTWKINKSLEKDYEEAY